MKRCLVQAQQCTTSTETSFSSQCAVAARVGNNNIFPARHKHGQTYVKLIANTHADTNSQIQNPNKIIYLVIRMLMLLPMPTGEQATHVILMLLSGFSSLLLFFE